MEPLRLLVEVSTGRMTFLPLRQSTTSKHCVELKSLCVLQLIIKHRRYPLSFVRRLSPDARELTPLPLSLLCLYPGVNDEDLFMLMIMIFCRGTYCMELSNFVARPLTARFVAVLKHFHFPSFIPTDIVVYSLYFPSLILLFGTPECRMGS